MGGLDDLYQELILDHYRRKRGEGSLDSPTVAVDQNNPLCGDEVHLELAIEDGRVVELAHTGQGCSATSRPTRSAWATRSPSRAWRSTRCA